MKRGLRGITFLLALLVGIMTISCKTPPKEMIAPGQYSVKEEGGSGARHSISSDFRIIYGENESEDNKNYGAVHLFNLIYEKTGTILEVLGDSSKKSKKEILVGVTNRDKGDTSDANLSYMDYGWDFDGTTVRIFGGSADALKNAVERFVEKYYDKSADTLAVSIGISVRANYSYPYEEITIFGTPLNQYQIAMREGYQDAANEVFKGFGRLIGVELPIVMVKENDLISDGKWIAVGLSDTGSSEYGYEVKNSSLSFLGNGLSVGLFNQLSNAVRVYFAQEFSVGTKKMKKNINQETAKWFQPEVDGMFCVDDAFVASLDNQFESAKKSILTSKSDYLATGDGRIYYVAPDGNDANDGMSQETPWATIGRVNQASLTPGSVVLFRRGGVWNNQGALQCQAGVTYSAYGTGAKPMLSNYAQGNRASDWTAVAPNIWVYSGSYSSELQNDHPNNPLLPGSYITSLNEDTSRNDDIGTIVFSRADGTVGWGVKTMKYNGEDACVAIGTVSSGFGTVTRNKESFRGGKDLAYNLEFYHDPNESRVYLYWDQGNPADCFTDIKLVVRGYLVAGSADQVTLDNLALKYAGCHGVSVGDASNFTVKNCEIEWIGGSIQLYDFGGRNCPTRFGEGIQNWGSCNGFIIQNNYIGQVYDGAISSQKSVSSQTMHCVMQNVTVTGNVCDYNSFSIELWLVLTAEQGGKEDFKFKNWNISGNMIRNTGLGFGQTRWDAGTSAATNSMGWPAPVYENVVCTENTFWNFKDHVMDGMSWGMELYQFFGNTVVQEYGMKFGDLCKDFDHRAQWDHAIYYYTAEDLHFLQSKNVVGDNTWLFTYHPDNLRKGA